VFASLRAASAVASGAQRKADASASRTFSPAAKLDDLSDRQKQEIERKSRPNAALIHETIRAEGASELERGVWSLAISALAAGLSIGFSFVVEGKIHSLIPQGAVRDLASPLGYTVGFLIVVLGRQQLFTENTLTPVLPLIHDRNLDTLRRFVRLWGVVLAANLAGAALFATALSHTGAFDGEMARTLLEVGRKTMSADFGTTFVRAVFAGWLIALMVWLLPAAGGSRPLIIIIITYVIAVCGFSHIIAGSVDGVYVVQMGAATWQEFASRFFAPTLLGNIVGGVALVAVLNYGQVANDVEPS
jgi:formate/nitrite transporter FocA (FNT family)